MLTISNSLIAISRTLGPFELFILYSLGAHALANVEITLANTCLGLMAGVITIFLCTQLATNYFKIVSNKGSIGR